MRLPASSNIYCNISKYFQVLTNGEKGAIFVNRFNKFVTILTNPLRKIKISFSHLEERMKKKNIKITACALAGAIAISGTAFQTDATSVSSFLPAAGLALTLKEGSSQQEIKASAKTVQAGKKKEEKSGLVNSFVEEMQEKKSSSEEDTTLKGKLETDEETEETTLIIEEDKKADAKKAAEEKAGVKVEAEEETEAETEEENEEEKEFSKLVIAKVNDYVNIRSTASEEGEILGKLYDKSVGDYISEKNGWYKITSGNVTGYVKAEYCVTGEEAVKLAKEVGTRVATVTTTTLKVRESEGMDAPVLGLVPVDEELSVVEELDGWVKVDIEEGYGYVSSDYVRLRTDFVKAESKEEEAARLQKEEDAKKAAKEAAKKAEEKVAKDRTEKSAAANTESKKENAAPAPVPSSGGSGMGSAVVDYAMQFVGNPYVYGGTSLTNGADCSGFVMSVYKNFGVSLPHSSSADRSQGYDVGGLANAQPGDLVCYSGHVGIYAGNGQIVHASTSKTGIIVSNANYRNVLAVRRIF